MKLVEEELEHAIPIVFKRFAGTHCGGKWLFSRDSTLGCAQSSDKSTDRGIPTGPESAMKDGLALWVLELEHPCVTEDFKNQVAALGAMLMHRSSELGCHQRQD